MTEIALVGGPLDGETRELGEPWPREQWEYQDPADEEVYAYLRDTLDDTEPYTFTYIDVSDYVEPEDPEAEEIPENQELLDSKGLTGEQGVVGERGPQGPPGADGVNLALWTWQAWRSRVAEADRILFEGLETVGGPTPDFLGTNAYINYPSIHGYDIYGWPDDMEPEQVVFGQITEPGSEHFFDEIESIHLDAQIAAYWMGERVPSMEDVRRGLPPGWWSESRRGAWKYREWCPAHDLLSEKSQAVQYSQQQNWAGMSQEGAAPNPRFTDSHWFIIINGWRFRGVGPKVQMYGAGSFTADPFDYFTADSIRANPEYGDAEHPFEWQTKPGTDELVTYHRNEYLARLNEVFRPARDVYFTGYTEPYDDPDFGPDGVNLIHFKLQADGALYLVDSGPMTHWYVGLKFGIYWVTAEWDAANSPFPLVMS